MKAPAHATMKRCRLWGDVPTQQTVQALQVLDMVLGPQAGVRIVTAGGGAAQDIAAE